MIDPDYPFRIDICVYRPVKRMFEGGEVKISLKHNCGTNAVIEMSDVQWHQEKVDSEHEVKLTAPIGRSV